MVYIALDGDDIGSKIELHIILKQDDKLAELSQDFKKALTILTNDIEQLGGNIIFSGGDSILARFDKPPSIDQIKSCLPDQEKFSFSIGCGKDMLEANIALKMAKSDGKSRWVEFSKLNKPEPLY